MTRGLFYKRHTGSLARCDLCSACGLHKVSRLCLIERAGGWGLGLGCRGSACSLEVLIPPVHLLCSFQAHSQNSYCLWKRVLVWVFFLMFEDFLAKEKQCRKSGYLPWLCKEFWIQIMQPWSQLVCHINLHFHCQGNKVEFPPPPTRVPFLCDRHCLGSRGSKFPFPLPCLIEVVSVTASIKI